jgi:hypothetical protein
VIIFNVFAAVVLHGYAVIAAVAAHGRDCAVLLHAASCLDTQVSYQVNNLAGRCLPAVVGEQRCLYLFFISGLIPGAIFAA